MVSGRETSGLNGGSVENSVMQPLYWPAKTAVSPRSSPLGTFREEERLFSLYNPVEPRGVLLFISHLLESIYVLTF